MNDRHPNVIWFVGLQHIGLILLLTALTSSAQGYISNDLSVDAGRFSRSVDDSSSFLESNQIPRYHKRELQSELLHLLGLKQRPRPAALRGGQNHSAPQFMLDLYNSLSTSIELDNDEDDDEEDGDRAEIYRDYHRNVLSSIMRMGSFNYTSSEIRAVDDADTIMSLPVHYRSQSLERHGPHRYHFGATPVPGHDILTSAELRVYRDIPAEEYSGGIFRVKVYQISGDGGRVFMDSVLVDSSDVGWIVFDVTYASHLLQSYPGAKLSIQLIAEDEQRQEINPDMIGMRGIGVEDLLEPFMVAFFKTHEEMREEQLSRVRRSKPRKNKRGRGKGGISVMQNDPMQSGLYSDVSPQRRPNRECRRRSLEVDFKSLDWTNWIIAPAGYHAYSCQGECSFPLHDKLNATNHAIVQTLVHILNPSIVPKACCAPTKLGPIQVLYFDDSTNVILRKYKNMVVKACGCH
ncbi:protein DVR-1 homolog isoform X2 [Apostichopus japonicus]